ARATGSRGGGSGCPVSRARTRPTSPGYAGFAAANVPGASRAAVSTGRQPPPNSRKIAARMAIVTPNLRRMPSARFIAKGGRIPHAGSARQRKTAEVRVDLRRLRCGALCAYALGVVVERELVRMRPEPERAHLVRHLVLDP